MVEWIRNSTPRLARAGLTPRQLLNPRLDKKAELLKGEVTVKKYKKYSDEWIKTQTQLIELVRGQLADWMDARLQLIHEEGAVSRMVFESGDFVLVQNKQRIKRSKLLRPFLGPYEVLGKGTAGSDSYQLFDVLTGKESEHHRDEMKLYHFRSMDNVVPMAMKGTDFVYIAKVLGHTGTAKTGADPYRFKVVGEDGQKFECSWEDVNRANAYIEYQQVHAELPPTTQVPVEGPW